VSNFTSALPNLVAFVDGKPVEGQYKVRPYGNIYSWETLLKTLEYLIPKVPQTVFFLRELRL
jgi:hypothetical protein